MMEDLQYSCLHKQHKGFAKRMGTINNKHTLAKTMEEGGA
jgi:hypothetical protein